MFIGRGQELHTLQELYVQSGFGMVVIQGRRRIGKSTLIAEFVKDKSSIRLRRLEPGETLSCFPARSLPRWIRIIRK